MQIQSYMHLVEIMFNRHCLVRKRQRGYLLSNDMNLSLRDKRDSRRNDKFACIEGGNFLISDLKVMSHRARDRSNLRDERVRQLHISYRVDEGL